jgi:hypothetical protein
MLAGCATSPRAVPPSQPEDDASRIQAASATQQPRGAGSLRQEAISLRLQFRGVTSRLLPLDESIIGLLAPDSYRSMRELLASRQDRIATARRTHGYDRFSIWLVTFQALEPDVRFSPADLVISVAGRDFRPIEIIPVSSGFGQQRIAQGQSQTALYLFDPALDVQQPFEAKMENARTLEWESILKVLERERTRIRARDTIPGQSPPNR